jgi:hypothetical protein
VSGIDETQGEMDDALSGLRWRVDKAQSNVRKALDLALQNAKLIGRQGTNLQHMIRALAVLWAEIEPTYIDPPLEGAECGPVGNSGVLTKGAPPDHWGELVTDPNLLLRLRAVIRWVGPEIDVAIEELPSETKARPR